MLKQAETEWYDQSKMAQPPSGGCVLKLFENQRVSVSGEPAAFGRLCVETSFSLSNFHHAVPAAFGRLCVETASDAIRRIAVSSRLRAAVC